MQDKQLYITKNGNIAAVKGKYTYYYLPKSGFIFPKPDGERAKQNLTPITTPAAAGIVRGEAERDFSDKFLDIVFSEKEKESVFVINTETYEEYKELMSILEKKWYKRNSWREIEEENNFLKYKENTCINIIDDKIMYGHKVRYINFWAVIKKYNEIEKVEKYCWKQFNREDIDPDLTYRIKTEICWNTTKYNLTTLWVEELEKILEKIGFRILSEKIQVNIWWEIIKNKDFWGYIIQWSLVELRTDNFWTVQVRYWNWCFNNMYIRDVYEISKEDKWSKYPKCNVKDFAKVYDDIKASFSLKEEL